MGDLAKGKRRVRQKKKPRSRKRTPARKAAARGRKRPTKREVRYNPLIALLMFLYMLKLIDQKTLTRIQEALYPTKRVRRKPRRRSRR
jgi:hypothetical protein